MIDVLNWPVIGRFLRWQHARLALQIPLLLIAGLIVFDGLVGPQLAPKNLATTGVWLHYRGLVVLALLLVGNLFCMACPFMLPRRAGRWLREHVLGGGRQPPRILRGKWVAIGLLLLFFFSYEHFDLWATPWWTAWLVIGYFTAAIAVDTVFAGAGFCKYACPLGQFNFFGSLISPFEVKVRQGATCAACATKDCITARPGRPGGRSAAARSGARGCELALFQPRKVGNMDCTFCLDCIHTCPYDNVGIISRAPTRELWTDPFRSGIGRLSRRWDLVVLVILLTFSAYLNAFAMIRPVYGFLERLATALGTASPLPGLLILFALGLVVLPALILSAAAFAGRGLGQLQGEWHAVLARFAYCLVPIGFGMWAAHYAFHFLTGALTIVPVTQSFLADIGLFRGPVTWGMGSLVPRAWLFPIEVLLLYLGALGSIVAAFKIAQDTVGCRAGSRPARPALVLGAALPWMLVTMLLLGAGLWILLQPMEMRGTMLMVTGG